VKVGAVQECATKVTSKNFNKEMLTPMALFASSMAWLERLKKMPKVEGIVFTSCPFEHEDSHGLMRASFR
jgi:hypothetical protein